MVFGSSRPWPPRRRAYDNIPCATRVDVPLPASTTWRNRKVSSSWGVSVFGPHPMHCDMPGASPWAFRYATKGASGGHTAAWVSGRSAGDGGSSKSQSHSSLPYEAGEGGSSLWTGGRCPHVARCRFKGKPVRKPMPQVEHRTCAEAAQAAALAAEHDLDLISRAASKIDYFYEDTCLHAHSADISDLPACGLVLTDFLSAYGLWPSPYEEYSVVQYSQSCRMACWAMLVSSITTSVYFPVFVIAAALVIWYYRTEYVICSTRPAVHNAKRPAIDATYIPI